MRMGPIFGYGKSAVLLGTQHGPRKGLCPLLEQAPLQADHTSQYTASELVKMEEMELGNPSSGRDLLFDLVCDFAVKLGLWAGPCLRKEQSSLPHGLNIPIYSRRVLFIAQNGAQEAAERPRPCISPA